jgi:hypothetical protein
MEFIKLEPSTFDSKSEVRVVLQKYQTLSFESIWNRIESTGVFGSPKAEIIMVHRDVERLIKLNLAEQTIAKLEESLF